MAEKRLGKGSRNAQGLVEAAAGGSSLDSGLFAVQSRTHLMLDAVSNVSAVDQCSLSKQWINAVFSNGQCKRSLEGSLVSSESV
jgi:hypothetical protein